MNYNEMHDITVRELLDKIETVCNEVSKCSLCKHYHNRPCPQECIRAIKHALDVVPIERRRIINDDWNRIPGF